MQRDSLAFLSSPEGASLLDWAASLPADALKRLTRLRRQCPPELAAAVVELLELRKRAGSKFTRADSMYFTPEGLEQASGETIARWRASRFPPGVTALDLCCGIGGDSAQLALRGSVIAIDRDRPAAFCARRNAGPYGAADFISVACADVTRLNFKGNAAFFDPSRRIQDRRMRRGEDYAPPLSFANAIRERIPDLCVKVSPGISDQELNTYEASITFVSDSGECKEAVMWFGGFRSSRVREAVILPAGAGLAQEPGLAPPPLSRPREWLFEPDPAIIRAHLIAEVAHRVNGCLIDSRIAYLTADCPSPTPFGAWYRILEALPFNLKVVRERMRALDGRLDSVKRRGAPLEPEVIARRLNVRGARPLTLVLTRAVGKLTALICERGIRAP